MWCYSVSHCSSLLKDQHNIFHLREELSLRFIPTSIIKSLLHYYNHYTIQYTTNAVNNYIRIYPLLNMYLALHNHINCDCGFEYLNTININPIPYSWFFSRYVNSANFAVVDHLWNLTPWKNQLPIAVYELLAEPFLKIKSWKNQKSAICGI